MIIPNINKIYEYNNENVVVWSQTFFKFVNIRTLPKKGGSIYKTVNWFDFVFKAKYKDKIKINTNY